MRTPQMRAGSIALIGARSIFTTTPVCQADDVMTLPRPCTDVDYLFAPAGRVLDLTKEISPDGRYHEVSGFGLGVIATPASGDGPTYRGRIAYIHTADDGTTGGGHAVSTMREVATLHGSDGSVKVARTVAHISETARPDEPYSLIRLYFEHATCAEVSR